ncbi:ABC transporter permease [Flagellimonas algicola]|uniref:FtsX-like permease family protein n=1 Tax=Flagellimonas algicola TaxID=2583815 RepID=A0ABY2WJ60_9FLAO|nr:ABC transporter permease [Allomuricauda algicola]TMU54577.1 FtsX-like permease family protein [Allomuricauda algicola]
MFTNHLKIAWRFFKKNKLFSAINVFGLAIGIAAFLILTRYTVFEKSYDSYLSEADDMYRVTLTTNHGDKGFSSSATNHPAVGPTLKEEFPEVEDYTIIADKSLVFSGTVILSYTNEFGEKIKSDIKDDHLYFANQSIIDMFNISLAQGNPKTALNEPNTIILSANVAKRFFGNEVPLGKEIKLNDGFALKVTGVFEEAPQNTHLPLGMVVSYTSFGLGGDFTNSWVWPEFYNYVKLKPGTDPKVVESKFPALAQKYLTEIMEEYGFKASFGLQPVRDIHLKSNLHKEISPNNSQLALSFLFIVAVFIIAIAIINFINLSTAKSMERAKEVGLKKVVGANRGMLIRQFLVESLIVNFFAMLLSILLVIISMHFVNSLVGVAVLSMDMWINRKVWVIMISLFVGGGILAGLYPAFVVSSFVPAHVLKGSFQSMGKGLGLRKVLVVVQFTVSITLIAGTSIVYNQFSYMQKQDLGFNAQQNLVVSAPTYSDSTLITKVEAFKQELIKDPRIKSVSMSNEIPGKAIEWGNSVRQAHKRRELAVSSRFMRIDHDFLNTYSISLTAGRNFTKEDATAYFGPEGPIPSGHRVIVNNTAARLLGFIEPDMALDQQIVYKFGPIDRRARIVGVVADHHQQSLQNDYEPLVFLYFDGFYFVDYLTINIESDMHASIPIIETKYQEFFPNDLFKYFFVDEYFNKQYQADIKLGKICLVFSILAIIIACLGLFGLGTHIAIQKTKELSVRKVLGASIIQALLIIPRSLLGLVLLSGTIALPITYFIAENWLENYAFRVKMNALMLIAPLLLVIFIALFSILPQSLRATMANPSVTLKNE